MAAGRIIIVIGGVRSGKTSWAEQTALQLAKDKNRRIVYLASGVSVDEEMKNRINRHQLDRRNENWMTIEQPVNLTEATKKLQNNDVVVWDCLTTWLTNEYIKYDNSSVNFSPENDLITLIEWAKKRLDTLFILSNEVLQEPVFTEGMTAHYQKKIGGLHQTAVRVSSIAIEMEAGLPLFRKGEWPG
ncbi:bifunctional adenosylcobinamide kinase/adenosylcobinamide-phosphate guanylyltransferase [Jeotgalibacillus campisalis]|uniref:Adenosylcobinamide kinase n=1 Tax=Jeotgalibacillus campisalis TaxID=220754 RepID=A0A0C2W9I3_9BACL|nr:bifunctional adenosylcobinamide kinase/adenosylcobinamide-phosphate guanylyltransferase [Jeotgalibacillus campisalis]KIL52698.1 hypothetical protein KR50_00270 [Jeotgalibacillus campisalis]